MSEPAPLSLTCPACGGEGALMMVLGKIRSPRATCLTCGRVWDSAAPSPQKGEGSPPPTAPDCPRHGPLSGPPPSAPDAVAEARRLYGEKIDLGHGAVLPRWGAFGRDIVGALLAEVDRLREVIALSRVRELVDRVTAAEAEVRRLRAAGPGPGGGTV